MNTPPLGFCPVPNHSQVPLIDYGGQPWCRFCSASRQKYVEQIFRWLFFCQWGLVIFVPLCIASFCVLSPVDMTTSIGQQQRTFWWYLLLPTSFVSAALAISLGHFLIQALDRVNGSVSGIVPWFHPTHALRDWTVVALIFSALYAPILFFGQGLSFLGNPAATGKDWLLTRAPLIFLLALFVLFLADRLRLITRNAILPQNANRGFYTALYAALLVVAYLIVQNQLAKYILTAPGPWLFLIAFSIMCFFAVMYLVVNSTLKKAAVKLGVSSKGPVPITIALIGPSYAGKTVFLSRAYSLLRNIKGGRIHLEPTPESNAYINKVLDYLEVTRDWPPTSVVASEIPFSLKYGMEELVKFTWLDLPGRVFTDPDDPAVEPEVKKFQEHLVLADAVAMVIDGEQLAKAVETKSDLLNQHIYTNVGESLYKRLKLVGEGARPVPLALIVTKTCLTKASSQARFGALLQNIVNAWHLYSQQSGLLRPPLIRTFYSSAVITSNQANEVPKHPHPLLSKQCVEPVLWLAAQSLRANLTLLDHASGFHGRSDLQEYVLQLEALSGR